MSAINSPVPLSASDIEYGDAGLFYVGGSFMSFTASCAEIGEALAKVSESFEEQVKILTESWATAMRAWSRALTVAAISEDYEASGRTCWRADAAEWLTLYLVRKGPTSTRRIKHAYRSKGSLNEIAFRELRAFAGQLGFLTGTTWVLPAEHPLAL